MEKLQAIIIDVDGTLAETERDGHRPAFNQAFAEYGLTWYWDEVLYGELLTVSGGKERIRYYAERYAPEVAAQPNFAQMVQQLHAAKTVHYVRLVETGRLPLRPGISRLIREARGAGIRLAIATTTSAANVNALLSASLAPEAPAWFEVIGAGDIVPNKKPAPDIYRWVLARLDLPAAGCLAIEDSENGLQSALGAGLRCLVRPGEYSVGQDFAKAWQVLHGLEETSLLETVLLAGMCPIESAGLPKAAV